MNAEILAVGTELLMGQIANTNAQYISKRLQDIGINVFYHSVAGDNPERLRGSLCIALERSDVIIMTGGLGPTQDDLTKETVAQVVGRELVVHEPSLQYIKGMFEKSGWTMVESNMRQAYFPEGSIVIKNDNGTAPGCIIETGEKVLIMLPGPPSEMKPMFEQSIIPFLEEKTQYKIVSKYLNIFGVGESLLEDMLIDLIEEQTNPTIATYAKEGEVTVRITSGSTRGNTEDLIAPVEKTIRERLGSSIYSTGDISLEETVGKLLMEKNITLAVDESFTCGLITATLGRIQGISRCFLQGMVTFSDVKADKETAVQRARNIMEISDSELGLSITGITEEVDNGSEKIQPAVVLALVSKNNGEVEVKELKLFGNVNRKRNMAVLHSLNIIRNYLLNINQGKDY